MDMNDILNRWDKIQSDEIRKKREHAYDKVLTKSPNSAASRQNVQTNSNNSNPEDENTKRINPMELWLRRYGTVDKDKIQEEDELRQKQTDHNFLREMRIEATIDLHGLHQDEAEKKLDYFVSDCKRRGIRKILIVHGKGIHSHGSDPVLGELVRKFIERDKRLGMSAHPDKNLGGNGATWVIIK